MAKKTNTQARQEADMLAGRGVRYTLERATDGAVDTMFDEGPFPTQGADYRSRPPSVGRQQLLQAWSKRDADGKPLFVVVKAEVGRANLTGTGGVIVELTGKDIPGIYHHAMSREVFFDQKTTEWAAAQADKIEQREERNNTGRLQRKVAEQKQAAEVVAAADRAASDAKLPAKPLKG